MSTPQSPPWQTFLDLSKRAKDGERKAIDALEDAAEAASCCEPAASVPTTSLKGASHASRFPHSRRPVNL